MKIGKLVGMGCVMLRACACDVVIVYIVISLASGGNEVGDHAEKAAEYIDLCTDSTHLTNPRPFREMQRCSNVPNTLRGKSWMAPYPDRFTRSITSVHIQLVPNSHADKITIQSSNVLAECQN